MKALMYSKQPSLSSRSSSDESVPGSDSIFMTMRNSSSVGSVITSFLMAHIKRFLVRSAMMPLSVTLYQCLEPRVNTAVFTASPGMFRVSLPQSTSQPLASALASTSPWFRGLSMFGSVSTRHVERSRTSPQKSVADLGSGVVTGRLLLPVNTGENEENE